MKIAYISVFQHLPANSGNDWYALQQLTDLMEMAEVHLYHTQEVDDKQGYMPEKVAITQESIATKITWGRISQRSRISQRLAQLKPEMLLDKSAVEQVKADIVFSCVYSFHIARHVAKANNAPIVLVMQNVEWEYLKHTGYSPLVYVPARLYENYVVKQADAVTVLSPRDYARATTITSAEKVFYVPYEPNCEIFGSNGARHDYGKDKLNLLFYGSLDRHHNIEALKFVKSELIPKLKERMLFNSTRINVFGSGDPPKHLDLENDLEINYLGPVETPGPYIRGSDVVIVPVRNSSGVKTRVLEALSCNKPVIAFSEATFGLEDESLGGITVADTAEGFVEALKLVGQESGCLSGLRRTDSSGIVATASDAMHYALESATKRKKTHQHRHTLPNVLR
jgi:glycosyltransferase involved in cell wall biosynthesis